MSLGGGGGCGSSKIALRNCSEDVEEKPEYIVLGETDKTKPPGSEIFKDYHLLGKSETSQVTEFSAFLLFRKMEESGLIDIIPFVAGRGGLSRAGS